MLVTEAAKFNIALGLAFDKIEVDGRIKIYNWTPQVAEEMFLQTFDKVYNI